MASDTSQPTQRYERVIIQELKLLSNDGHKYVTGREVMISLAKKLGILSSQDLHKILEDEIKKVIHKFYPGATMYTSIYASPGHRERIELKPELSTLSSSFDATHTVTLSRDTFIMLYRVAESIDQSYLTEHELSFMQELTSKYGFLASPLDPNPQDLPPVQPEAQSA